MHGSRQALIFEPRPRQALYPSFALAFTCLLRIPGRRKRRIDSQRECFAVYHNCIACPLGTLEPFNRVKNEGKDVYHSDK